MCIIVFQNKDDADDIMQEIYMTAFQKFSTLKNINSFKAWIIEIAKNKCRDYYRSIAKSEELSFIIFCRLISNKADMELRNRQMFLKY